MKKTVYLLFCFVNIFSIAQTKKISTLTGEYNVCLGLESASKINPDSVEALSINCDKIDSIGNNITRYKNLKFLRIARCKYSTAFESNKLADSQKDYYIRQMKRMDSLSIARVVEFKKQGRDVERVFFDWDSLIFVNRIVGVSRNFHNLKFLECIEISCEISEASKKELMKFYSKKKKPAYLNIGDMEKSKGCNKLID